MRWLLWLSIVIALPNAILASGPYHDLDLLIQAELEGVPVEVWSPDSAAKENPRWVSSGLAVLLGPFAAHRLYLGTTSKVAIIYGATFGGFGILVLLDLGHLLFTKDLDVYRNSDRVFMWSRKPRPTPP